MYLCLFLFPFFGFLVSGSFGRLFGKQGAAFIATFCVCCSCLCSFVAFYEVGLTSCPVTLSLFPWICVDVVESFWSISVDSLTAVMLVVITTISSLVHVYSISYIKDDPFLARFISYLSLFTFLMLSLVLADNYLQLFFGWEGVGLASFLLISFWSSRLQACKAATKAIIINRVGDVGLALALFCFILIFGSVEYSTIFSCSSKVAFCTFLFCQFKVDILSCIGVLLLIGASGKSAQIGLHTWLPDAIEGPTPVSALIHAATMVTAGVFVLARSSPILEFSPVVLFFVSLVGAFTAFFAATTGLVQNDLKRVIAYSTCSQLGYMVFASGLSQYALGVFHLSNHAFFKALLFLGAGCIIHAIKDEQDLRRIGGLAYLLPFTYSFILVGSLALVGFPFLTGFYSKDAILEFSLSNFSVAGGLCHWFGVISALFTSFYSFRLLVLGFLGYPNGFKSFYKNCHEAPLFIAVSLIPLGLGSLFIGFFCRELFLGAGTPFWANSIFIYPVRESIIEAECAPVILKQIPLFFTVMGAAVSFSFIYHNPIITYRSLFFNQMFRVFYTFLNQRWLFDRVYNESFAKAFLFFGHAISFRIVDKGALEILGPFGIVFIFPGLSKQLISLQSGRVYHNVLFIVYGLGFLLCSPLFYSSNGCFFLISVGCWIVFRVF